MCIYVKAPRSVLPDTRERESELSSERARCGAPVRARRVDVDRRAAVGVVDHDRLELAAVPVVARREVRRRPRAAVAAGGAIEL